MRIYLVQHAEAKKKEDDPLRPLTEEGEKNAEKMASYASKMGITVAKILHSGKLRAKQTTDIFSKHLNPKEGVFEIKGLNPLDSPNEIVEKIEALNDDVMIVGHMPHLSKLLSFLILNKENPDIVKFRNAGITCLEKNEHHSWKIVWVLTPEIV